MLLVWNIRRFNVFFFNDTATTEIYTLSLHDALPIYVPIFLTYLFQIAALFVAVKARTPDRDVASLLDALILTVSIDRKSTRLNSSHANISYAVFCLKKKINITINMS